MSRAQPPPTTPRPEPAPARPHKPLPTGVATWLIDGFNVLHAGFFEERTRTQWWTAEHRNRLVERLRGFNLAADAVWVVFDGSRTPPNDDSDESDKTTTDTLLHQVFAPSADDWLVRRVRESADPGTVAVVTGDRAVANRVRHHHACVVSPRDFLAHCGDSGSEAELTGDARL